MATRFKGGEAEVRALGTFVKLVRASNTIFHQANADLGAADLSPSQFAVLEALYHVGPLCLGDLARRILKSSGNLTLVIDNLQKRGLVQRQKQGGDKRFILATITPAGQKLIETIFPGHARRITELMARLTPEEQDQLARLCRKLGKGDGGG